MIRSASSASIIAALALAGCGTPTQGPLPAATMRTTDGTPVVSASANPVGTSASGGASAHRSGFGIIEAISLVKPPVSAAAGATAPVVASGPYRLTVRMEDGSIQSMVVDNRAFLVGDRVQILPDGRIVRA